MLVPSDAWAERGRGHVRVVRLCSAAVAISPSTIRSGTTDGGGPGAGRGYAGAYDGGSSARIQVTPRNTEVYVDGYLAGTVDDFDGFAQRLRVEPGEHLIELYLDGHRTISQSIYQPGETYHLRHVMEPLASGEAAPAKPTPRVTSSQPGPPGRPGPGPMGPRPPARSRRARSRPPGRRRRDAYDTRAWGCRRGHRWRAMGEPGGQRLQVQVAPGSHRIEVQKDGYQTFTATVQVRAGESTPLNVSLTPK